jgi:hypothetical protein
MSSIDIAAIRQEYWQACARERWGEAAVVAVLLGNERFAADERLYRHASKDGVRWDQALAEATWSSSEYFILATAAGLWTGRRTQIDISYASFLDDNFYALWQAMLTAARTGHVPEGW